MTPAVEGTWLVGSGVRDGIPVKELSAEKLITRSLALAPNACILGGGEWRHDKKDPLNNETDWLVRTSRYIHQELTGKPMPNDKEGTQYYHFLVRSLRGKMRSKTVRKNVAAGKFPELPYGRFFKEDVDAIRQGIEGMEGKKARPMKGMPSATGLRFFSGIDAEHQELFEQKLAEQICEIVAEDPETVIQLELPAELAFMALFALTKKMKKKLAAQLAASIERVVRLCPKGTRFAFHLCWGDLNHKPFVPHMFQSSLAKVMLVNAIAMLSVWKKGWKLFGFQDPFCDGKHKASNKEGDYAAYDLLEPLPEGVIYALGVLHAGAGLEHTREVVRLIVSKLKKAKVERIAFATPCGNGRTPLAEVAEEYYIGLTLAKEWDLAA